jgi:hypothetical protein
MLPMLAFGICLTVVVHWYIGNEITKQTHAIADKTQDKLELEKTGKHTGCEPNSPKTLTVPSNKKRWRRLSTKQ